MNNCNYFEAYIKGVKFPLPELVRTFADEKKYLISQIQNLKDEARILELGCGMGRPLNKIASHSPEKKFYGIDYDSRMLDLARKEKPTNTKYFEQNALETNFNNNFFHLSYSTYNLVGSIAKEDINLLLKEQKRITQGNIISIFWNEKNSTTEFLKRYYDDIGIEVYFQDSVLYTNKGTRIPPTEEIITNYERNNLKILSIDEVGDLWIALKGVLDV